MVSILRLHHNPLGQRGAFASIRAMSSDKTIFTYQEALQTFPKVRTLTSIAFHQVESLVNRIQSFEELNSRREELEEAYQAIVEAWMQQVTALGCEVKGLWLVDWDCGHGAYCWRFPEETLAYFHVDGEGDQGRVPVN